MHKLYPVFLRVLPVVVVLGILTTLFLFGIDIYLFSKAGGDAPIRLLGLTAVHRLLALAVDLAILLGAGAVLRLRIQQLSVSGDMRECLRGEERSRKFARIVGIGVIVTAAWWIVAPFLTAAVLDRPLFEGKPWRIALVILGGIETAAEHLTLLVAAEAALRIVSEFRFTKSPEDEAATFA